VGDRRPRRRAVSRARRRPHPDPCRCPRRLHGPDRRGDHPGRCRRRL